MLGGRGALGSPGGGSGVALRVGGRRCRGRSGLMEPQPPLRPLTLVVYGPD